MIPALLNRVEESEKHKARMSTTVVVCELCGVIVDQESEGWLIIQRKTFCVTAARCRLVGWEVDIRRHKADGSVAQEEMGSSHMLAAEPDIVEEASGCTSHISGVCRDRMGNVFGGVLSAAV